MTYLLDLVFNAMVMVIGLQDLDTPTNMERLKQNLKVLFQGTVSRILLAIPRN